MKDFVLFLKVTIKGSFNIHAETLDDAIEKLHDEFDLQDERLDVSMYDIEVDEEITKEINNPEESESWGS